MAPGILYRECTTADKTKGVDGVPVFQRLISDPFFAF